MAASMLCNKFFKLPQTCGRSLLRNLSSKELNEKFYQSILQVYENDNSITINEIEKRPACDKGACFVSEVSRVMVYGHRFSNQKSEEYEKSLILKELPSDEQGQLYRSSIAMENEKKAYKKIIPILKKYAGALPLADCIYADGDVVVLQDLSIDGFEAVGKSSGGLSLEQCGIVLEGLAKLHASSFLFKQKDPKNFEKVTKFTTEILFNGGDSMLLNHQPQRIENVMEMFRKLPSNTEYQKAIDVLQDLKQHSNSRIKQLLLNPTEHSVICHGDAWAGNIMFNKKNELKLVDLQLMRYSSVASDLCYLLYVNLLPELRIQNMDELLDGYLNSLRINVKEKGVNLDKVLTKEWLEKEMKAFSVFGIVFAMYIMPVFFIKKEELEMSKKKVNETKNVVKGSLPECEERVKELILGYVKSLC